MNPSLSHNSKANSNIIFSLLNISYFQREGILKVTEGFHVDILCYGYEGYPEPKFIWLAPIRSNLSASLQIYEVNLK